MGLLTRWGDESELVGAVFGAAMDPRRPGGSRAAVGAFCDRQGLVPDDEVDRALFFVLTGQPDARRALDPDGALLAAGYRSADGATRAALREALTGGGDLDLVRAITDRQDGAGHRMSDEEVDYALRRLAQHEEWDELWRLVSGLRVDRAVAAMEHFADWRPAGSAARALFDRLAAADAAETSALVARMATPRPLFPAPLVEKVALAPDLSEVAFVEASERRQLRVHSLPDGQQVASINLDRPASFVVHLGDAVVHDELTGRLDMPDGSQNANVVRRRRSSWAPEVIARGRIRGAQPVGAGFVLDKAGELLASATSSSELTRLPTESLGLGPVVVRATEPASGLLAVQAERDPFTLAVVDVDGQRVARAEDLPLAEECDVWFLDPQRVLVEEMEGEERVLSLRFEGESLVVDAVATVDGFLTPLPALDVIAIWGTAADQPAWLDAATLAPTDPPPSLGSGIPIYLVPGGTHAVVEREDGVEVPDLRLLDVAELVGRPLAELRPGDLRAVTAAEARDLDEDVRALLGLLRAALEHRFGAEVALGEAVPVAGGETDIALGGSRACPVSPVYGSPSQERRWQGRRRSLPPAQAMEEDAVQRRPWPERRAP